VWLSSRHYVATKRITAAWTEWSLCLHKSINVGVTQVGEHVWLVTFMRYDLGYFDDETCRLEPIENPFTPKVLPMSSE
jgi:hypothetical protein